MNWNWVNIEHFLYIFCERKETQKVKNVNLMVGMIGGIVAVIWTIIIFIAGMFAGAKLINSARKEHELKVVK